MFGADAQHAKTWLTDLSNDFDPPYLRRERDTVDKEASARYARLAARIRAKLPELEALAQSAEPWKKIYCHARLDALLADGLCARAAGDEALATAKADELRELAYSMYEDTYGSLDTRFYVSIIRSVLTAEPTTFARVVQTER